MSQNAHTLLLFFDNSEKFKNCFKMFKGLEADRPEKVQEASKTLGIDVRSAWNDDWFNQQVSASTKFIRLDYESSTSYEVPLEVLESLFRAGLRLACLEIFNDQVGEFAQFFFKDGKQVDRQRLYRKNPKIEAIIGTQFECDPDDLEEHEQSGVSASIPELIKAKETQEEDAMEMVSAIRDLAKAMNETGEHPMDLVRDAMLINEMKTALIKGIGFGVVTVLLFKGMWLWIILSIVLTVILLIYGSMKVNAEFDDDDDDDDDASSERTEGET
jgi:hypothetical protein